MRTLIFLLLAIPLIGTAQLPTNSYFSKNQTTWLSTYVYNPLNSRITTVDNKVNANEVKRKADSSNFANKIKTINDQISSTASKILVLQGEDIRISKRIDSLYFTLSDLKLQVWNLQTRQLIINVDTNYINKLPVRFSVIKDTLILKN